MEQPIKCRFCKETEFKFHDKLFIYDPELDNEELIESVYECTACEAVYFMTEGYQCAQISKDVSAKECTPRLDKYMNS